MTSPAPPLRPRELLLAAILIAVVGAGLMRAAGAFDLIDRPLWLDEVLTWLLVTDPSWAHMFAALRGAVDTNPPGLHVLMRIFCAPFGDGPAPMRVFAVVSIYLALLGVYVGLRRAFGVLPAAAGVAALASNELVVFHAFEARFYGPLLAASVWAAVLLQAMQSTRRTVLVGAAAGIVSIILCTLHYFGVFSLLCVVGAILLFDYNPLKRKLMLLLPAGAGLIALAACLPMFLAQRTGLATTTWVDPTDMPRLRAFLLDVLSVWPLLLLAAVWGATRLFRGPSSEKPPSWRASAPLASLGAVAVIVVIFSIVVQPALIDRYAIAAVVINSVLAASIVSRVRVAIQAVMVIGLIVLTLLPGPASTGTGWKMRDSPLVRRTERWKTFELNLQDLTADLRSIPPQRALLFTHRQALYPAAWFAPEMRDRMFYYDPLIPPGTPGKHHDIYEADMARRVEFFYGWPKVLDPNRVNSIKHYDLIEGDKPPKRIR